METHWRCLENFLRFARFEVDDGTRTHFWHACWKGDSPFLGRYLELFMIARERDGQVEDYISD
mgnify:CR=1 FL=1